MATLYTLKNITPYDLVVHHTGGIYTIPAGGTQDVDLTDSKIQTEMISLTSDGRAVVLGPAGGGTTTVDLGTFVGYSGVGVPQNGSVFDLGAGAHSGVTTVTLSNTNISTDTNVELQVYVITGDTATIDGTWQIAPVSQPGGGGIDPAGTFDAYCDWFETTPTTPQTMFGILKRYVALRMRFGSGTSPHADIAATMKVIS